MGSRPSVRNPGCYPNFDSCRTLASTFHERRLDDTRLEALAYYKQRTPCHKIWAVYCIGRSN